MIKKIGTLGQYGGPILLDRILTNSITIAVSDSVRTLAGFAALGLTNARVLGHVESIVSTDGLSPVKDGSYLGNLASSYAVSATNQTVAMVSARMDVDQYALYLADMSAALNTTAGSGLAGKTFDIQNQSTILESTVSELTNQYYSHGPDRVSPTRLVVNILESEVFGF